MSKLSNRLSRFSERLLGISEADSRRRIRAGIMRTFDDESGKRIVDYREEALYAFLRTLDFLRAIAEALAIKDARATLSITEFGARQCGKLYLLWAFAAHASRRGAEGDSQQLSCGNSVPPMLAAVRAAPVLADPFVFPSGCSLAGIVDESFLKRPRSASGVVSYDPSVPLRRLKPQASIIGSLGTGKGHYLGNSSSSKSHVTIGNTGTEKTSLSQRMKGAKRSARAAKGELKPGSTDRASLEVFRRMLAAGRVSAFMLPEAVALEPYGWRALGRDKPWPLARPRISYRLAIRAPGFETDGGEPASWMRPYRRRPISEDERRDNEDESTGAGNEWQGPLTPQRASAELLVLALEDSTGGGEYTPESNPDGVIEQVRGLPGRWFYKTLLPRLLAAFLSPSYDSIRSRTEIAQNAVWRAAERRSSEYSKESGTEAVDGREALDSIGRRGRVEADISTAGEGGAKDSGFARGEGYLDARDTDLSATRYLSGVLTNADFRDSRLERASFRGSRMESSDLRRSKASRCSFRRADMRGSLLDDLEIPAADFDNANLALASLKRIDASKEAASFAGAVMLDADLTEARLRESNLNGVSGAGAILRGADFHGASLCESSWQYAYAERSTLSNTDLTGADLSGINAQGADLEMARLGSARLRGADLRGASLGNAIDSGGSGNQPSHGMTKARAAREEDAPDVGMDPLGSTSSDTTEPSLPPAGRVCLHGGVDLREASLVDADLEYCQFFSAIADEADFSDADLEHARIQGQLRGICLRGASAMDFHAPFSDISGADLREACLMGADMRHTNLYDARLGGTDLRDADLSHSKLRGAREFASAKLEGTNLHGADLTDEQRVLAHMMGAKLDKSGS